jgi:hypothetical protein
MLGHFGRCISYFRKASSWVPRVFLALGNGHPIHPHPPFVDGPVDGIVRRISSCFPRTSLFSCVHGSVPSSHPSIHPSIYPSVQWSFNNGPFTFWYRCRVRKYAQGIFRRCGPFTDPMCILSIIAYCLLQYITHGKSPSIVIPRHSKCLSKKCQSSDNLHLKWSCSGTYL